MNASQQSPRSSRYALLCLTLATTSSACGGEDEAAREESPHAACPAPTSGPTIHTTVSGDEEWTADASPHVVQSTGRLRVEDATVTVAPCATVTFAENAGLFITSGGRLQAHGTAAEPIVFQRHDSAPWAHIWIQAPGTASLEHVTIRGGGSDMGTFDGASIIADGSGSGPEIERLLHVRSVVISDSQGYGLMVRRYAGFSELSEGLTIRGSGAADDPDPDLQRPLYILLQALGTLPSGHYTGNGDDRIQVSSQSDVKADLRVTDPGVPLYFNDGFSIIGPSLDGPAAIMSIAEGVELQFDGDANSAGNLFIRIGTSTGKGALQANGVAGRPVIFTSGAATPAPGDWLGINFNEHAKESAQALQHVVIEYAGGGAGRGASGWSCPVKDGDGTFLPLNAAVAVLGWEPVASFLNGATIRHSAGHGVLRGWQVQSVEPPVDFSVGNTLGHDLGGFLDQTTPIPKTGAGDCPP